MPADARRGKKRARSEMSGDESSTTSSCSRSIDGDDDRNLCKFCASIDLDEVFGRDIKDIRGSLVSPLGPHVESGRSSCPLCAICRSYCPTTHGTSDSKYCIVALSAKRSFLGLTGAQYRQEPPADSIWLAISRTVKIPGKAQIEEAIDEFGCFGELDSDANVADRTSSVRCGIRRLSPAVFDVDLAKDWLAYCEKHHDETCRAGSPEEVTQLRVLDCDTKQVVPAPPGCRYVALSYVWGTQRYIPMNTGTETRFPKVIEDSIDVTVRLGMRYLWVDRVCIDQANPEEQHQQVSQMDRTFSMSTLTIIAAAGDGPDHGLPGVRGTERLQQPIICINGRELGSSLSSPRRVVGASTWATRAWTYQEGLLSRRRLIFTEQQVFFDCRILYCCESLNIPLDNLSHKHRPKSKSHCHTSGPLVVKDPGADPTDYMRYVLEYTGRKLTYPSDILNAFRGIQNAFTAAPTGLLTFYGLPMRRRLDDRPTERLAKNLFWHHDDRDLPTKRRDGFPSWSWVGWVGKLGDAEPKIHSEFGGSSISAEKTDGSFVDLDSIPSEFEGILFEDLFTGILRIESWAVNMRYVLYHVRNDTTKVVRGFAVEALRHNVDCPHHSDSQADRVFDMSKCERGFVPLEGSSSDWPGLGTSIKIPLGAQILAMMLFGMQCSYNAKHIDFTMCSLLLLQKSGDSYTRIGILPYSNGTLLSICNWENQVNTGTSGARHPNHWIPRWKWRDVRIS